MLAHRQPSGASQRDPICTRLIQEEHLVSLLSLLPNIIWVLTGGLWMAAGWLFAAVIMAVTIVGLPWSRAAWNIAVYTFLPFGRTALSREEVEGVGDIGTGPLGVFGNVIWLLLAGWWLALGHMITGIALAVMIIGIPFAWAHLKLALLSLWPIGKTIVNVEDVGIRRG
jgi:uncharacterized membrane protein YccF (DUF307 family)